MLLKLKSHIKLHTPIVGDFNIPLSPLNTSARQKLNREIREIKDVITQIELTDICRPFHPNIKEYSFFLAPQETSKITTCSATKQILNRYNKNLEKLYESYQITMA